MKKLFITLILVIGFYNASNKTVIYRLHRIDHNLHGYVLPINIATGEVKSGKANIIEMPAGEYYIGWYDSDKILYNTNKFRHDTDMLTVYVNGDIKEEDLDADR